jgi:hypothetical protein
MIIAQLGSATERSPHRYEEEILAFKDILLALTSYPEPSPLSVVDDAVSIAAAFGAHLTALSCETHVQVPGHFLLGSFANIPGIIAGEGAKSRQNAQDLLAAFDKAAEKADVPHETILQKCSSTEFADLLVDYARLRYLTIIAGILRANVRGGGYIRVRQAYPGLAGNPTVSSFRARNRRCGLGFQPRRRAFDIGRSSTSRKSRERACSHNCGRKTHGHKAFRRGAFEESSSARNRYRA